MFGLDKLRLRKPAPTPLPPDVAAALAAWRTRPGPDLDQPHFLTRYVVVDIATAGPHSAPPSAQSPLRALAACSVYRGQIQPDDNLWIDFSVARTPEALARTWLAFVAYCAKAPVVAYHLPLVGSVLQRDIASALDFDFSPPWADLALLLPAYYREHHLGTVPLDTWLDDFQLAQGRGRRDPVVNVHLLARLFLRVMAQAIRQEADSAAALLAESRSAQQFQQAL